MITINTTTYRDVRDDSNDATSFRCGTNDLRMKRSFCMIITTCILFCIFHAFCCEVSSKKIIRLDSTRVVAYTYDSFSCV